MSEQDLRTELDHRERTAEAKTDTKFERVLAEMRVSNASLGGKIDTATAEAKGRTDSLQARIESLPGRFTFFITVLATVLAAVGAVLGALQLGSGMFGNGFAASQMTHAAAQEAIAAAKR